MLAKKKKQKEEEAKIKKLRSIQKSNSLNRKCFDCNEIGPQYICLDFYTFICTTCSGIHREFGHRVKSISMSEFSTDEIDTLEQKGGNERGQLNWRKNFNQDLKPDNRNRDKIRNFIQKTYIDKVWVMEKKEALSASRGEKEKVVEKEKQEDWNAFSDDGDFHPFGENSDGFSPNKNVSMSFDQFTGSKDEDPFDDFDTEQNSTTKNDFDDFGDFGPPLSATNDPFTAFDEPKSSALNDFQSSNVVHTNAKHPVDPFDAFQSSTPTYTDPFEATSSTSQSIDPFQAMDSISKNNDPFQAAGSNPQHSDPFQTMNVPSGATSIPSADPFQALNTPASIEAPSKPSTTVDPFDAFNNMDSLSATLPSPSNLPSQTHYQSSQQIPTPQGNGFSMQQGKGFSMQPYPNHAMPQHAPSFHQPRMPPSNYSTQFQSPSNIQPQSNINAPRKPNHSPTSSHEHLPMDRRPSATTDPFASLTQDSLPRQPTNTKIELKLAIERFTWQETKMERAIQRFNNLQLNNENEKDLEIQKMKMEFEKIAIDQDKALYHLEMENKQLKSELGRKQNVEMEKDALLQQLEYQVKEYQKRVLDIEKELHQVQTINYGLLLHVQQSNPAQGLTSPRNIF